MLKQLLCSLQQFARMKHNEVKKGFYSCEFAASLIQSYTKSMIKALTIIGREAYTKKIQSEADKLCLSIYSGYKPPKLKLTKKKKVTRQSGIRSLKKCASRFGPQRAETH
ncbi:hypothetical protein [Vibrio salinus]|uniref:hypothetical protein n=1 Tax=Vibrio salinus TaxID=2899784 RepID=UPI001E621912|nr:hypothetical protein [Vibrio salinus]MCE0492433.1 hypothetical protein [Vibrio salinus]